MTISRWNVKKALLTPKLSLKCHVMFNTFLNSLPPVFILILIIWSYYSYIIQFCIIFLTSYAKKLIYLIIYHILLLMFMWSFLQTMCKRHDPVPDEYRLESDEHIRLLARREDEANFILKKVINLRRLEIYTCTPNGRVRYCKVCMLIKPDRSHHCSTCTKCILKMDHHCPWVSNCVGFCNYKHFVLTLMYGMTWCCFYVATVAEYLVVIWKDFQNSVSKLIIGIGFLAATFAGMLIGILFFYHVGLVCRNETTLEALRDISFQQDNVTFDLGKWRNFTEVFGDDICFWLLPVQSGKGNGHEFQVANLII